MNQKKKQVSQWMGVLCLLGVISGEPLIAATLPGDGSILPSVAQQGDYTLTGSVLDEFGGPVVGANVVIKGTTMGVVTDIDGKFSIQVPANAVLVISYIGYNSIEIPLNGQKSLNVTMKDDAVALEVVVVVG